MAVVVSSMMCMSTTAMIGNDGRGACYGYVAGDGGSDPDRCPFHHLHIVIRDAEEDAEALAGARTQSVEHVAVLVGTFAGGLGDRSDGPLDSLRGRIDLREGHDSFKGLHRILSKMLEMHVFVNFGERLHFSMLLLVNYFPF